MTDFPKIFQYKSISFIFSDNAVGPRYEDTPDIQAGSPLCRAAKFALHSETSKELSQVAICALFYESA